MVKNLRKPKKGALANQFRAPDKGEGLDWDLIMHHGVPKEERGEPLPQRLQLSLGELDRANRGLNNQYDLTEAQREARSRNGKKLGARPRQAPFDVDELVKLYLEGLTVKELVKRFSTTEVTVRKYLKKAEVYDRSRDLKKPTGGRGAGKQDKCKRGHDTSTPDKRDDWGRCKECRPEQNAKDYGWDRDPSNPKNGGSGTRDEYRLRRNTEKAKEKREACPRCGHQAAKHHRTGCPVGRPRCACKATPEQVRAFWVEVRNLWAAPDFVTCVIEGCGRVPDDHTVQETIDHFGLDVP